MMTVEERIRWYMGEMVVQNFGLQHQNTELQLRVAQVEEQLKRLKNDEESSPDDTD